MAWNRLWGVAAVAALACGVAWATAEPARGGRAVPDAEAALVFGGATTTTPTCTKGYYSNPCDAGTNCATNANTYSNKSDGTVKVYKTTTVYCGTGMNCGFRYEASGCDLK